MKKYNRILAFLLAVLILTSSSVFPLHESISYAMENTAVAESDGNNTDKAEISDEKPTEVDSISGSEDSTVELDAITGDNPKTDESLKEELAPKGELAPKIDEKPLDINPSENKIKIEKSKVEENKIVEPKKEATLIYQRLEATIRSDKFEIDPEPIDTRIFIEGELPEGAVVEAIKTSFESEFTNREILESYRLEIRDKDGRFFKPTFNNNIIVEILNNEYRESKNIAIFSYDGRDYRELLNESLEPEVLRFRISNLDEIIIDRDKIEEKLTYQQLLADIYTDGTYSDKKWFQDSRIKISGNLPGYARVKAYPVEVEIEGVEILAAYDIKIFDRDNREYKVTKSNEIKVEITNKKIKQAEEISIYHKEDIYSKEEKIEEVEKNGDKVTFSADSFSIYAIASDIEIDQGVSIDLEYQEFLATVYEDNTYSKIKADNNTTIKVSGVFPQVEYKYKEYKYKEYNNSIDEYVDATKYFNSQARAYPITSNIDGKEVILGYNIQIFEPIMPEETEENTSPPYRQLDPSYEPYEVTEQNQAKLRFTNLREFKQTEVQVLDSTGQQYQITNKTDYVIEFKAPTFGDFVVVKADKTDTTGDNSKTEKIELTLTVEGATNLIADYVRDNIPRSNQQFNIIDADHISTIKIDKDSAFKVRLVSREGFNSTKINYYLKDDTGEYVLQEKQSLDYPVTSVGDIPAFVINPSVDAKVEIKNYNAPTEKVEFSPNYPKNVSNKADGSNITTADRKYRVVEVNPGETQLTNPLSKIKPTIGAPRGYTFLGWSEKPDAKKAQYGPNDPIDITSTKVFYAVWDELDKIYDLKITNEIHDKYLKPDEKVTYIIEYDEKIEAQGGGEDQLVTRTEEVKLGNNETKTINLPKGRSNYSVTVFTDDNENKQSFTLSDGTRESKNRPLRLSDFNNNRKEVIEVKGDIKRNYIDVSTNVEPTNITILENGSRLDHTITTKAQDIRVLENSTLRFLVKNRPADTKATRLIITLEEGTEIIEDVDTLNTLSNSYNSRDVKSVRIVHGYKVILDPNYPTVEDNNETVQYEGDFKKTTYFVENPKFTLPNLDTNDLRSKNRHFWGWSPIKSNFDEYHPAEYKPGQVIDLSKLDNLTLYGVWDMYLENSIKIIYKAQGGGLPNLIYRNQKSTYTYYVTDGYMLESAPLWRPNQPVVMSAPLGVPITITQEIKGFNRTDTLATDYEIYKNGELIKTGSLENTGTTTKEGSLDITVDSPNMEIVFINRIANDRKISFTSNKTSNRVGVKMGDNTRYTEGVGRTPTTAAFTIPDGEEVQIVAPVRGDYLQVAITTIGRPKEYIYLKRADIGRANEYKFNLRVTGDTRLDFNYQDTPFDMKQIDINYRNMPGADLWVDGYGNKISEKNIPNYKLEKVSDNINLKFTDFFNLYDIPVGFTVDFYSNKEGYDVTFQDKYTSRSYPYNNLPDYIYVKFSEPQTFTVNIDNQTDYEGDINFDLAYGASKLDYNGYSSTENLKNNYSLNAVRNGKTSMDTLVPTNSWNYKINPKTKLPDGYYYQIKKISDWEYTIEITNKRNVNLHSNYPANVKSNNGNTLVNTTKEYNKDLLPGFEIFSADKKDKPAGYRIIGWSEKETDQTPTYSIGDDVPYGTENLYAIWDKYKIKLNSNIPTGARDANNKKLDSTEVVMEGSVFPGSEVFNERVPDGFTFLGWSPNPYDRTPKYKEGDIEDIYDSETVYAIWKREKIRYETNFPQDALSGNGGNLTNDSKLVEEDIIKEYKDVFSTNSTNYPADYAFFGWSTNPKVSRPDYSPGERIADSDSILYAVWKKPEITLHTNYPAINQGLTNSFKTYTPSKNIWDKHFNQSGNDLKPVGYDLLGWSTSPDGEVEFSDEEPLDTPKLAIDADLYAIWSEPKNVWITVNNEVDDDLHKTDNVSVRLRYEVGSTGYDLPWNLEIAHGQVTQFIVPTHAENITIYVKDSENKYRVIRVDEVTEPGQNNGYNPKALQGEFSETTHNEANPVVIYITRNYTFKVDPNYPEEAKYKVDGSQITGEDKVQKAYERNKKILDNFQLTDELGVWNRHFGLKNLPAGYDLKGWTTKKDSDKVEFLDISDIDIARFPDLEVIYAVFSKSKEVHIKLEDTDKLLQADDNVAVKVIYKLKIDGEDKEFIEELTFDKEDILSVKLPTHASDIKIVADTPDAIVIDTIDNVKADLDKDGNFYNSPKRLEGDFKADAAPSNNPIVIKISNLPPPTGVMDNIMPMAILVMISVSALAVVLYKKSRLGGYDEI